MTPLWTFKWHIWRLFWHIYGTYDASFDIHMTHDASFDMMHDNAGVGVWSQYFKHTPASAYMISKEASYVSDVCQTTSNLSNTCQTTDFYMSNWYESYGAQCVSHIYQTRAMCSIGMSNNVKCVCQTTSMCRSKNWLLYVKHIWLIWRAICVMCMSTRPPYVAYLCKTNLVCRMYVNKLTSVWCAICVMCVWQYVKKGAIRSIWMALARRNKACVFRETIYVPLFWNL